MPDSRDHPKNRMLCLRTEGLEPGENWKAKKVEKNSHSSSVAKDNPTKPGCNGKIPRAHGVRRCHPIEISARETQPSTWMWR